MSLNWPLDAQSKPCFGRQAFLKNIVHKAPRIVNDDIWTFDSQSSSQCKLELFDSNGILLKPVLLGMGYAILPIRKNRSFITVLLLTTFMVKAVQTSMGFKV